MSKEKIIPGSENHICIVCSSRMKLSERLENGKNEYRSGYRRRRFKCENCDYTELVFANGAHDLID